MQGKVASLRFGEQHFVVIVQFLLVILVRWPFWC